MLFDFILGIGLWGSEFFVCYSKYERMVNSDFLMWCFEYMYKMWVFINVV